ncbi:hypothetical protein NG697_06190 [Pseudarthrobacter sp. MDT3-26]|nr:hypothetical protein [Pseudarthrobacter sp. MDT3-26]
MMALVTVSAIFLRWLPHHGMPILLLLAVAIAAAGAIYLTQRRRYNASASGLTRESLDANTSAILWTAFAGISLGGLGITVVVAD